MLILMISNLPYCVRIENKTEQAGAELGQAELKLELDFTLIFFRFGAKVLVGLIQFFRFE